MTDIRNNDKGMTLIELTIGCAMTAIIMGSVLVFYITGVDLYNTGSSLAWSETMMQLRLDDVIDELIETSDEKLTVYNWVDGQIGPITQTAACFPSARDDANGNFIVANNLPQWQSVVVLAPYRDSDRARGCLKRYESFGAYSFPVAVSSIDANQITLSNGVVFNRSGGAVLLENIAGFDVQMLKQSGNNPVVATLLNYVLMPKGNEVELTLQSTINCRN